MSKNNEYRSFLKENFPNTSIIQNDCAYNIYSRVCENNLTTDIFIENIKCRLGDKEQCVNSLINRYREQFNRLLIIIPLNDIYSSSFYMRVISENLLKLTYALNFNDSLENISNLRFRDLNEELNKLKEINPKYREAIKNVFSLYGRYSNFLHNKNNNGSEIEIMEQIIKSNEVDLKKIDNDLMSILKSYQVIISNHFEIEECLLTTAQKIRVNKRLSRARANKFKENLFKK